jgi:hypothetical protein
MHEMRAGAAAVLLGAPFVSVSLLCTCTISKKPKRRSCPVQICLQHALHDARAAGLPAEGNASRPSSVEWF